MPTCCSLLLFVLLHNNADLPCLFPQHTQTQPVVVALSAYANSFQYYSGGVMNDFTGCCTTADCQVRVG
jgi:hypothetical protein